MIQFFHRTLFNNQYYLSQGFRAIFLRIFCEIAVRFFKKRFYYRAIIARQKSCEKLANRRAASDEKPTPVLQWSIEFCLSKCTKKFKILHNFLL